MSGEVGYLGEEKTRFLLSIRWQAPYLITSSAMTQKRPYGASQTITAFSIAQPGEERMTMCSRRYINMIQSPYPSKIFTRKPNQLGMHLGCISLQTPPLPSIAYCVGCSRIMIIISSLHSKCISSFASVSLPSLLLSTMDLCLPDLHDSPDIPSAHRTHIHLSRALIACNNMSAIVE